MSNELTISPELRDCLALQRSVLAEYIRTIDALIAVVIGHESACTIRTETTTIPTECTPVLGLMLQAVGTSSNTLARLSDRPGLHTRDCYSIVRSVVELAVNICYIIATGPEAASRAKRHAHQKAFRDLKRESTIGLTHIQLRYQGAPEPETIEGLEEEILEFSTRRGHEKGWVDASIDDRIAAVEQLNPNAMTTLHWARFAIYRHSSEVLHGTYFSALHFFGLTKPSGAPRSSQDLEEDLGQQHMLVLMSATLSLSAIVKAFHAAYGFHSAQKRDEELIAALRQIPIFQSNPPSNMG